MASILILKLIPMLSESTFYSWLIKQQNRKDPIGDLARDIKRDERFPATQTDIQLFHSHLIHHSACPEAHCALDEAFREFSLPKSTRDSLSLKLRFQVFKRESYRCQICGASANSGVCLEIDHKLPISKGGSNSIENLWVLCFEYNRGKGAETI
ncbi:MAG: hypothetical protein DU481_00330 [Nitrosomonas sp.]|uniref:YozE family protein n=1 Tax=Nitrosomonas sp. TaxID=42353 RepID=UPI0032EF630E